MAVAEMAAIGIGLPKDAFTGLMKQGPHLLAPTGSDLRRHGKEGTVFAGYQYDLNFLTIHGRSRFPGLSIWLWNGQKVEVKVPVGCLLIQTGKQPLLCTTTCSSPFHGPYDAPLPAPPDPEQQKCIDKLVEYAAKNGPEFEATIREKQQENPAYSFLFGGEGHNYYRYKLWLATHPPFNAPPLPPSSVNMLHPPNHMMSQPHSAASPSIMLGGPPMHQPPFPSYYDHQHSQPFIGHGHPEYDQSSKVFKGLSGPLPSNVAAEMNNVLNSLTGTKESIKGAKMWFMQRSPFAPALAEALRDRVSSLDDPEKQLHIVYLANDILFDRGSTKRGKNNVLMVKQGANFG